MKTARHRGPVAHLSWRGFLAAPVVALIGTIPGWTASGPPSPRRVESAAGASAPKEAREKRVERAYDAIREKRWKEAIPMLESLLEEDPSDMRLRMELAYARQAVGDLAAAADDFRIAARDPNPFREQAREALKVIETESTPAAQDISVNALLDQGYAELRRGNRAAARRKFDAALAADPEKTEVTKQLGYLSIADGNLKAAAAEFAGARRLDGSDAQSALELGYLYDSLHQETAAEKAFEAALSSPDPRVYAAAAAALKDLRSRTGPFYVDIYATPFYAARFSDAVGYLEATAGYKPEWAGPVSVYLAVRDTQDSRSQGGTVPVIYSDNYASVAPGIRLQPAGFNANLSAEWGGSLNFLRGGDHPHATEADGRVVLSDYRYWSGPRRLFADVGASVGYYSRYRDNVIGYLQLRAGFKAWDNRYSQMRLYAPINALRDTNRDFFNNIAEAGVGFELQPEAKTNLKIRFEYLRGTYMGISGRDPNPYGAHYDDVRFTLIYSGHFASARRRDAGPSPSGTSSPW